MAARDYSAWVPVPTSPTVTGQVAKTSALQVAGRLVSMTSDTLEIPALLGADVGGGIDLVEDTNDGKKCTLYSYLYNGKHTMDESQVEDAVSDPMGAASIAWNNRLIVSVDNAAFGVSGARSSTVTDYRPYNSVYYRLTNNDADTGYTANANVVTAGALTYTSASQVLGKVEGGDYFDEGEIVFVAHPSLREKVRGILDDSHRPIFIDGGANVLQSTLFGHQILFTSGAKVSTSFKMTSVGSPLLICVNRNYLAYGLRIAPESRFIPASANTGQLAHTLQHRARLGAALTVPAAASMQVISA